MKLNTDDWKEFRLDKIFSIDRGKEAAPNQNEDGDCLLINETDNNNGFTRKVVPTKVFKGNAITVSINFGENVFYQPEDFCASVNIAILKNNDMNEYSGLFLVNILKAENKKYSYGYKTSNERLLNTILKLPILHNDDGTPFIDETHQYSEEGYVPDWKWMEDYIKFLKHKPLTTKNKPEYVSDLKVKEWKEFYFGKLISKIYKAKALNKDDLVEANDIEDGIRYITRTSENNGCELLADINGISEEYIEEGNAISIGDTTATCFYQKNKFITGDHMVVVRTDWLNELVALYIVTILNNERYKYSYGRAFLMDRIKETLIKLPIKHNPDGTPFIDEKHQYSEKGYIPDWQFMEDYMKSLPYGDRI